MDNIVNIVLILGLLMWYTWRELKRASYIKGWWMTFLAGCSVLCLTAVTSLAALYGSYLLDSYPLWLSLGGLTLLAIPFHLYEYKLYKLKAPSVYPLQSKGWSLVLNVAVAVGILFLLKYFI